MTPQLEELDLTRVMAVRTIANADARPSTTTGGKPPGGTLSLCSTAAIDGKRFNMGIVDLIVRERSDLLLTTLQGVFPLLLFL